jgi:hypothetical protein
VFRNGKKTAIFELSINEEFLYKRAVRYIKIRELRGLESYCATLNINGRRGLEIQYQEWRMRE